MKPNPSVSIIIPTYNVENILEKCLLSIKNQTYKLVEILVIDDSSTDKTKQIAEKYGKYFIYLDPEEEKKKKLNISFKRKDKRSAQRNYGAGKAKGDFLLFIDSDMVLPSNLVEESIKAVNGKDCLLIYDNGIGTTFWSKCHSFEKDIHEGDTEVTSPRLIKKSAFLSVDGIDENLVLNEDLDLHEKLKAKNFSIGILNNPKIDHYETDSLIKVIKKYYHYGKSFNQYAKKNPKKSAKIYILYHPYLYLKNWKKLLKAPVYGIGSILRKIIEYASAFSGFIMSLKRK